MEQRNIDILRNYFKSQEVTQEETSSAEFIPLLKKIPLGINSNILYFSKPKDQETNTLFMQIMKIFQPLKPIFYVQEHHIQQLKDLMRDQEHKIQQFSTSQNIKYQLIITIGGDGTVLYCLRFFQNQVPPIIAYEKGTLGFMPVYNLDHLQQDMCNVLKHIEEGSQLQVEERIRIHGRLITNHKIQSSYHSINEFVIDRGEFSSLLKIDIYCNNVFFTKFQGDGIIISTPTGSTAYNLSAGGPIVSNEVNCIIITPICPFSLSFRPICMSPCSQLKIIISSDARGIGKISADGQYMGILNQGQEFLITRSPYSVYMVKDTLQEANIQDWSEKLKKLLKWNKFSSKKIKK